MWCGRLPNLVLMIVKIPNIVYKEIWNEYLWGIYSSKIKHLDGSWRASTVGWRLTWHVVDPGSLSSTPKYCEEKPLYIDEYDQNQNKMKGKQHSFLISSFDLGPSSEVGPLYRTWSHGRNFHCCHIIYEGNSWPVSSLCLKNSISVIYYKF